MSARLPSHQRNTRGHRPRLQCELGASPTRSHVHDPPLRRLFVPSHRAFVSVWFMASCIIFGVMSSIADKVFRNERLSFEEGVELYRSTDFLALGRLANYVRERLNGNLTYYN